MTNSLTQILIRLAEQGKVPDPLIRAGIRFLLSRLITSLPGRDCEAAMREKRAFIAMMDAAPAALVPERANAQHYEVPASFFEAMLGPRRKYSSCYWPDSVTRLEEAEEASLAMTAEHLGLRDGDQVLELGCGWGSMSLYMAARFPSSHITAVSNSHGQRLHIESERDRRGLGNLEVITADMNDFQADIGRYDRVVSIEMFEHMRNHRLLYRRVHDWLRPGGRFLMHIFVHREHPYPFNDVGPQDWMSHYFFAGGIMPSDDLPLYFQEDLKLLTHWRWNGQHYERTLNAWLARMDRSRDRIWPILEQTYGAADAGIWWMRWRLFLMASAELFGYRKGQEWFVSHYLFERPEN